MLGLESNQSCYCFTLHKELSITCLYCSRPTVNKLTSRLCLQILDIREATNLCVLRFLGVLTWAQRAINSTNPPACLEIICLVRSLSIVANLLLPDFLNAFT